MKKFLLLTIMALSMNFLMAQTTTTATYNAGDIPTPIGAYDGTCNGPTTPLVVTIPAGNYVFSVDVSYDITAGSGAWMSEQNSQIFCQDTGLDEGGFITGTGGNSGGTESYSRTGLDIATGVDADGILTFEMRAYRTWGGTLCDVQYQAIDDGTWTISVVHGDAPSCIPPSSGTISNITGSTADFSWMEEGTATAWDLEYGVAGFAPTGTPTAGYNDITTNPVTLTGLSGVTTYDVYYRADCGMDDGDVSIWVGPVTFTTACTEISLYPACEDFSSPGLPNCWGMVGNSAWEFGNENAGGAGYGASLATDHTLGGGTNYAWMDGSDTGPGEQTELITPLYNISSLTNPYLSYWVFTNNTNNPGDNNTLNVEMWDGAAWIPVETIAGDNPNWVEYGVDVNAVGTVTGNLVQFKFIFTSTAGTDFYNDILIDDVCMDEAPSCPTPSSFAVTNVLATTADVNFNYSGPGTNFTVEYGPVGFVPGTGAGTVVTFTTPPPFTLTGLTPSSELQVFVQEDCGGGLSGWAGPATIQTACVAINTFPACEDFAAGNIPNCWSMVGNDDWLFSTGAGYGAIPAGDHTIGGGTNYAWMDGSVADPGDLNELITPFYDVSTLANPYLSYWVFSNNVDNPGDNNTLYVEVNDGNSWTLVETIVGDNPSWLEYGIDVNSVVTLAGNLVQFRFVFESTAGTDFYNDILIDDVCMDEAPSCPTPSSLTVTNVTATTADIDFNYSGPGTSFIVEFGPLGFVPGTGAGTQVTINTPPPFTLTGLPPSSDVQIFVYEECAPGDDSDWAGPATIQTSCVAISTFPACEDFASANLPNCWSMNGNDDWLFSLGAGYGAIPAGDHTAGGGTNYAWMDGSFADPGDLNELVTPFYDVSSLNAPYLSYWVFTNNVDNPGDNNTLYVELWDGAQWILVETIQGDNPDWVEYTVDVNQVATVTGDIQFRFVFESTAGTDFYNDILIDDVCLKELPLDDIGVTAITAPTSGCGMGVEDIVIEVTNLGFNTQGGFFTGYSVNGVVQTAVPDGFISNNIVSGAMETYTFTTQYDFSAPGTYTVKAWTSLNGDSDATNDTTTVIINNVPVINTLPYFEDFEVSDGGYVAENASPTASVVWEWGAPTGGVIDAAGSGVNSWVTNLAGNYENNTTTYLTAPCMDFSSLSVDPELSFALRTDSETGFDGAWVDISFDGGATYTLLGSDADVDWYNNPDQQFQGNNGAWTTVSHTLDGAAGQGSVRVRFGFDSDGSVSGFDGAGIDDVSIIDVCAAGFGLSASATDEGVQGVSADGTATVTPTTGMAPYTFEWNDPAGQTTDTATGLNEGVYTVTVTDAMGCKDEIQVTVGSICLAQFIDGISYTEESQNGTTNDGSVTINATSPTPPYTFDWSTGDQTTDAAGSSTLTGLTAGMYYVTVTDGNGCSDVDSIVVTAFCPVNLGADISATVETTVGSADGTATATPTVGTAPYTYAWSDSQTTQTATGLSTGTYSVTITDANGCTEIASVDVDLTCPASLGASASGFDETLQGANDGAATATATAGTPPYQYDWSNGAVGNTVTNLAPGSYSVTITDANGCTEEATATVNASGISTPIEEIESLSSLILAPNPTSGEAVLSVRFSENVDMDVEIINTVGQVLNRYQYTSTISEDVNINLNGAPAGIYFVRLKVGNAIHTDRIVKR